MSIACSPWMTDRARDVPVISPIPRTPIYTGEQALEKRSKTCHFVPLFGTPVATESVQGSLGKPFQDHDLRPCQPPAEPAKNQLAYAVANVPPIVRVMFTILRPTPHRGVTMP